MKTIAFASILMTSLFLLSCNRSDDDPTAVEDEQQITEVTAIAGFINTFIDAGRARNLTVPDDLGGITFEFRRIGGSTIGYCEYDPARGNHIALDEQYWSGASNQERAVLLFHELGHCFLNRDHDDAVLSDGTCKSIMHADESNCLVAYNDHVDRYLDELFATGIVARLTVSTATIRSTATE
ncbi:MAG: hypothetical protein AAGN35_15855 [Bacteroidota bacterium]